MKKLYLLIILPFLLLGLSGCTQSPESVMKSMIKNMVKTSSYHYDASIGLLGTIPGLAVVVNPQTASNNDNTKIKISGDVDMSDPDKYLQLINIVLGQGDNNSDQNLDFSMVLSSQETYIKVNSMPQVTGTDASALGDDWYKFDLNSLGSEAPVDEQGTELSSADLRKIKSLVSKTQFFQIVEDLGQTDLNNINTYHFRLKLNKSEIKQFLIKLNKIVDNEQLTTDEEADLEASLTKWEKFEPEVWIGVDDKLLYRVELGTNIDDPDSSISRVDAALNFSKYNKKVDIDVPATAKPFDLAEILQMPDLNNPTAPEVNLDDFDNMSEQDLQKLNEMINQYGGQLDNQ
ncbi:hypothetical protein A2533_04770 [Candidatus Falkowbacteria bacterium RIFOXYD2_FULL_35_9]|uniref:Lipoprotein n=1 Tax=Candidatus Falkowbacteria bacterium RIFOXYC2_FULL_36_12 TaxID=1798002 RepID=A0A1F5SY91_9BACT|nr:MAG: hypothetical protein A2478_04335 [Candidatus Falkowbacteria bacterium RIFOXYC2_FULL_36_12]OGF33185.1 MAG: hypothetical protein A2223_04955 [Candidatus Falkowbacteria bacterium RIFOXYA2_FULL_35_8]OGF46168.1 MAG: hypothetical protein A2533_04770 [Candidatus Falkowbacteria bacterium RIFOXYD2_FULL_35_9]